MWFEYEKDDKHDSVAEFPDGRETRRGTSGSVELSLTFCSAGGVLWTLSSPSGPREPASSARRATRLAGQQRAFAGEKKGGAGLKAWGRSHVLEQRMRL